LWAHATTNLYYLVRQHPFGVARLQDEDLSLDFAQMTHPEDRIAVIATEPLTVGEEWVQFKPGELKAFVAGAPL
jgi:glutamine amidotransferase